MSKKTATLGSRVREARERLGISQRELGRRLGLHHMFVNRLEVDSDVTAEVLMWLSAVLGVSTDFLLHGNNSEKPLATTK